MITEPGCYQMTLAEYLADPCPEPSLSSHLADILLRQSPLHAKLAHPRLNPHLARDTSAAFDLGTAVHQLVLEGDERFCVIEAPDYKKPVTRKYRDDARAAGQIPILIAQMATVRAMAWSIHLQLEVFPDPKPLRAGKPERVLIWREGAIWCRARLDWLHDDHRTVDDLKTTSESAHPAEWSRHLFDRGGDLQAAFHSRGVQKVFDLYPGTYPDFRFLIAETELPYALSLVALDPEALAFGDERMHEAIALWKDCLTTGEWPGYPRRTIYAEVPPWVKTRWMERKHLKP